MKNRYRLALAAAALVAAAVPGSAFAQAAKPAAAAAPAAHKVGLVDMAYVFQNYKKLDQLREQLKTEYESNNGEVAALQNELKTLQETFQSGTLKKDSPAWAANEQKFIELKSQLQAKMTNLNREFARKEAVMYKQVYDEVSTLVTKYAEYYQYTLILRYQRETAEEQDDVSKVVNRLNQLVVYHQEGDDITERLLTVLNKPYEKAGDAAAAPAAPKR